VRASGLVAATLIGLAALADSASAQAAGARIYGTVCGACHQAQGTGVHGMFPPLAGSEWVTGPEARLVRIIMHGVTGDIEVNKEIYSSTMPPFGSALSDGDIAAVASYIRGNFTNKAAPITEATVAKVRSETASRNKPWTVAELNAAVKTAAPAKAPAAAKAPAKKKATAKASAKKST
jgi:mono/diheme cytochrome c family protein